MGTVVKTKVCKAPTDVNLRAILYSISSTTTRKEVECSLIKIRGLSCKIPSGTKTRSIRFFLIFLNLGHKK